MNTPPLHGNFAKGMNARAVIPFRGVGLSHFSSLLCAGPSAGASASAFFLAVEGPSTAVNVVEAG